MSAILLPLSSIMASILTTTSITSSLLIPLNFTIISTGKFESESFCKSGLCSRPTTTLFPFGGPQEDDDDDEEEEEDEVVESKESFLKVLSWSPLSLETRKLFCNLLPSSSPCWWRNLEENVEEVRSGGGGDVEDDDDVDELGDEED